MSDKEKLLALWIEGNLDGSEQATFDKLYHGDDAFRARVDSARWAKQQAQVYPQQSVPHWHRPSLPRVSGNDGSWWARSGMATLSMAMSLMAVALVLLRVQVQWQDDSLTLSFAGKGTEQEIQHQVDSRLAEYQVQQKQFLTDFADHIRDQQKLANTQLTNYLLKSSRTERREDFAELIKYVNQQRADDQVFYAKQLNKLQQKLDTAPGETDAQPNQQMR